MKKLLLVIFTILIGLVANSQTQVCPDVVCINSSNQDYFVINTPGSTYNWTITGGGVIASGQGTSTIFINWGSSIGTYFIEVIETNALGCVGLPVNCQIDVVSGPNVTITPLGPLCVGDPIVNLVGTPSGGVFSGIGVVGNTFNPSVGSQTVTYTYNDPNGCSGVATLFIVVSPIPITSAIYKD